MTLWREPVRVAVGLLAVTLGCRPSGESANDLKVEATLKATEAITAGASSDPPAHREVVGIDATPTMSAAVAALATSCSGGHRVGTALEPPRQISARYADGVWEVELEGMWQFIPPVRSVPEGVPTREPWRDLMFMVTCRMTIDAATGYVVSSGGTTITATPPAR